MPRCMFDSPIDILSTDKMCFGPKAHDTLQHDPEFLFSTFKLPVAFQILSLLFVPTTIYIFNYIFYYVKNNCTFTQLLILYKNKLP